MPLNVMKRLSQTPRSPVARAGVGALVLALWLGGPGAWAARADRDQPMNIEADALRHEDNRQTSVFTGNVVVTKGSIVIRGHQIEVRQNPQGQQFGTVVGNAQQQAYFRQKRDVADESIEGTADRIEYNGQADTVRFIGRATLKRFRGTQLNDETVGNTIVYDNGNDVFTVQGGSATANNPGGRVRAMITPVPAANAAAPAAEPGGAPALRSAPTLGEGRR